jgi:hypothetical protein
MRVLLLAIPLALAQFMSAQSFSGNIEFRYSTQKDTTMNAYIVKEPLVRLDQFAKKGGGIEGSFLFDLQKNEIRFLNPKRKIYGSQKSETPQIIRGTCEVVKGANTKKIAGVKCTEYIVKNTEENTFITYWIGENNMTFFAPLVKLWNRKDKQSIYFGQIKNLPAGAMPMMSEEKQLNDGRILTKLEVIKVTPASPPESTFAIPAGYSKFEQ